MNAKKVTLLAAIMISTYGCAQASPDSFTGMPTSLTEVKREAALERFHTCVEEWTHVERRCGSNCTLYGSEGAEKYSACLNRSGLKRYAE